jgi:predicted dehydrogenase
METTRRTFLLGSLSSAPALAGPRALASDRISLGFMGCGGRAGDLMKGFAKRKDVEIAWLADPDSGRLESRAAEMEKLTGRRPKTSQDFRRILDDKAVTALVNATPDHWHALGTILACQAGKDVYVEKPASYSPWEGRKMVEAARKYSRVVQVGAQNRSAPYVMAAIDHVRSGKLGSVHLVKVFNSKPRTTIGKKPDGPVPQGVDYEMWLGPARKRPFNPNHFHYNWHWFWEYSGGDIVNDGIHQIDMARWVIDRPYPRSVYSTGGLHYFKDDQECPDTQFVAWDYDDLTMVFEQAIWVPYQQKTPFNLRDRDVLPKWPFSGTRIEVYGSKNWMMLGRHGDGWEVYDGEFKTIASHYGRQANDEHFANFIECIRTRNRPTADIEELHLSTLLCQHGNIAYRTGRKLMVDPKTETFVKDPEANRLTRRPAYRSPWVIPESV